jgi:ABC-type maltose transport system permease subunit
LALLDQVLLANTQKVSLGQSRDPAWLLTGYFKIIPFELEKCALIDGSSRWQILTKIVLPLAILG